MRILALLALMTLLAGCAAPPAATNAAEPPPPDLSLPPQRVTMPGVPLAAATPPPPPPPPPAPPAPPTPSELGVLELRILDDAFETPTITVPAGTTIIWRNEGTLMHSVVSADGGFAGSGPIGPGSEYMRTFERPGTYAYHDRYHPDMRGTITIE